MAVDIDYATLNDQDLLERFQQGDGQAANYLYSRYARRVRGLVQKKLRRISHVS